MVRVWHIRINGCHVVLLKHRKCFSRLSERILERK